MSYETVGSSARNLRARNCRENHVGIQSGVFNYEKFKLDTCSLTHTWSRADSVTNRHAENQWWVNDFSLSWRQWLLASQWLSVNRPGSIYQYCNMTPRLSGGNCKFLNFLLSLNSQKRLGYKENNTKCRRLSWKPRSHVRILIYRMWPIDQVKYSAHMRQ